MIADDPSARGHELRDLLARNGIPFGFYPRDSPEGQAALRRLGVDEPAGPVLSLYTGVVLVDPANAEVAEALGLAARPAGQVYDVVIVGAGPAGLAAAVYAASEGLRTALLEREAFGGQGFILTGSDTGQDWPLQRAPFLLETTNPGVFAAGDVRHGSMKRVAAAIGDGSTAIRLIHDYLALAPPNARVNKSRLPATRAIGTSAEMHAWNAIIG